MMSYITKLAGKDLPRYLNKIELLAYLCNSREDRGGHHPLSFGRFVW